VAGGGPILLLQHDSIPAPTAQELRRLRPARLVVLGGPASVSDRVLNGLDGYATSVTRISGADRYAAAAAISRASFATADAVYIATGTNFPDALAGGPVAAAEGAPLLLVPTGPVPSSVLNEIRRLDPSRIVVLGGTRSVPQATVNAIIAALGG
jgi:putative cell wall-binding protein